jgi:exopolysaccharide production protein ExoQ
MRMSLISSTEPLRTPAPFLALAAPWLMQGILLICATRGYPPFFSEAGTDVYTGGSSLISATALYLIRLAIWMGTLFMVMPMTRSMHALGANRMLLLSLPALAFISAAWSTAPRNTLAASLSLLLLTVAGIYIGSTLLAAQQMQVIMVTGAVAAIASLLLAGLFPSEGMDATGHFGAIKGIFTHKNSCGFFMALLSTPAFFVRRTMRVNRMLVWGYGGLCALLVLLSQSRTAWIDMACIGLAAAGLPMLRAFRPRDGVILAGVAAMAALLAGYAVYVNLDTILAVMGKDPTFSGRALIWQAVFAAILKRPLLGYGYLAFFSSLSAGAGSLVLTTHFVVNHPHNGYLAVWLNLGLVGLVLLALMVFKAAVNAGRSWRQNPHTDWYLCLIVLILVENFSEIGLVTPDDLSWLLFVVACVGLHQAAHPAQAAAKVRAGLPVPAWVGR